MHLLGDWTLQVVASGAALLGAVAGALGCFAVLRRQSLLGDTLSHAALPGIALAFLAVGAKDPLLILLGAGVTGLIGTGAVHVVVRRSRIPMDSAQGMVLSVFFGLGLVLLTVIQRRPNAAQAGLESFLFGQAALLLKRDVVVLAVLSAVVLVILLAFWKELKMLVFDPDTGRALGLPLARLDVVLAALLVTVIVLGLQTAGVVLMSALIVAPAVAARQWSTRLGVMVGLAAVFGALSGLSGAVLSSVVPRLPTGPTVVLILSVVVLVSLLFAPGRGIVWRRLHLGRLRSAPKQEPVLMHLYALSLQHPDNPFHGHNVAVVQTMNPADVDVVAALEGLERRSLAQRDGAGLWSPTELGRREAEKVMDRGRRERS